MVIQRIILFAVLLSIIPLMTYAQGQFTRITEGPHVSDNDQSSGLSWIDINDDGYDDLYITNIDSDNRLYRNNGNGSFTKLYGNIVSCNPGDVNSTSSCWGDINNDGYPDVYITTYSESSPPANIAFINNGDETFAQMSHGAIISETNISFDASWVDYNNDGMIDLYATNFIGPNNLYRQDDTGFALVTDPPFASDISASLNSVWADYNNDGDMDLFVANAWGDRHDYLYENNNNGSFTKNTSVILTIASYDSWGGSWGDYDNDGDQDIFVASYGSGDPSMNYDYLYINNGDGTFGIDPNLAPCLVSAQTGGSAWGDYDNDGLLDLFVAAAGLNLLYKNQGDGAFIRITEGDIVTDDIVSRAGAWSDYDRDGDLDLYVVNGDYLENSFYHNNGNSNCWINIECIGTNSNRSAIGTKVRIKANINGEPLWQMREISSKTGKSGQNSLNAHFGLGDATVIDSIKIEWPSGMVDIYTDVSVNQFITYTETVCGDADGNFNVNLLDITYLISYLYKGGPAPEHMQAADPDGNGTTNILDMTYLIAYLYKGGMKPVC